MTATYTPAMAIASGLRRYADFNGRSSRSEYWYLALFGALLGIVGSVLDGVLFGSSRFSPFSTLLLVGLLLPNFAVTVRRLHDKDLSGWWYLLICLPVIGALILLIWFCGRGTVGPNRFGEDPLE